MEERRQVNLDVCNERHAYIAQQIGEIRDDNKKLFELVNDIRENIKNIAVGAAEDKTWAKIGKYGMALTALCSTLFGIAYMFFRVIGG